ncbi:MAG: hypothetical protein R3Y22_09110 [Bacteroidales bacterium]
MRKIIPKSKLVSNTTRIKTAENSSYDKLKKNEDLLFKAKCYWDSLDSFRKERERNKQYTYGNQWGDIIEHNGESKTEEEYIREQGGIPLKNNLIRRLVRTLVGVYRNQSKEPTCYANDRDEQRVGETMSIALQVNRKLNRLKEISARSFEEFLISGAAFHKETYGWRNDKKDCWTDIVSGNHIFFDTAMRDIRHWDLTLIGEIHDLSFEQLCSNFANNNRDYKQLKKIYSAEATREFISTIDFGDSSQLSNIDFLVPYNKQMCRVIEIWSKEQKPRYRCHDYLTGEYYKIESNELKDIITENKIREADGAVQGLSTDDIPLIETEWFVDDLWYYRFLTPTGETLLEGETPYNHKSHPYTIKLYPFIDGEIHSFVSDIIDQQRYVNRLITTNDFVIKSSAKGVLMVPNDAIPEDKNIEDFASEWARPDGLIVYNPTRSGQMPQQIANKSTNVGLWELLQMQINLMEEISGVTGALQGRKGFSGQSASHFNMEYNNSSTALLDILDSYSGFIIDSTIKKVKNIQQFYDTHRVINIVGKNAVVDYDPVKVSDVEFDLAVEESINTPAYRMLSNEWLLTMWQRNAISIEQLLQHGNFPFADELLQSIQADKEALAQGETPNGVPQQIKDNISENVNPEQLQELMKALQSQGEMPQQ